MIWYKLAGMTVEDKRGPGLRFPPPLLALAVIGGAWLADWLRPLPIVAGDEYLESKRQVRRWL